MDGLSFMLRINTISRQFAYTAIATTEIIFTFFVFMIYPNIASRIYQNKNNLKLGSCSSINIQRGASNE